MTILGIGTDLVDIRRVASVRYLERAAEFIFLPQELRAMKKSRDAAQFVASRLAAKEAVIKAYPASIGYHDFSIEVRNKKPAVAFVNPALQKSVFLSITHEKEYAASVALVAQE